MIIHIRKTVSAVFVALLLFSAVAVPAAAQSDESNAEPSTYETFVAMADLYNEQAASLDLGVAESLLAGQRVNAYISDGAAVESFSFALDDQMRIVDISPDPDSDATVRFETDRATVERIVESPNPADAFGTAVVNDDIRIEGESGNVVSQLVWSVANVLKGFLF
ncbi:hypothetical protein SAMN04488063_2260 [Halopelagius inordinatus]|uniref:SCP-2 sterol transfer family protein n=1 Tax=Halopelagius inordinatus TaxID=553467 RepID=A0A1I2SD92_9EURY|nr:hypothetical protein [Halopelagius inordinatus]SFG50794.1 hypothetical protein SAMN04488063_2260 [Halopelagius inordinatus]